MIVYTGLSMTYAIYEQKNYRMLAMFRGSLISMIYGKTLKLASSDIDDAEAITLMSADIDRIESFTIAHEMYASVIEASVALWLLFKLLGVAMMAPVVWVVACFFIGLPLATAAGNAQIPWLEAIEDRLAATSKLLSMAKPIRMTGLSDIMAAKVQFLRQQEVQASRSHRVLGIYMAMWHFVASGMASVWGFGAYILLAKGGSDTLTEGVAFAALSLFEILEQPLSSVVDGFELVQTVLNSFSRIQEYLLSDEQEDYRADLSSDTRITDQDSVEPVESDLTTLYSRDGLSSDTFAAAFNVSAGYRKKNEKAQDEDSDSDSLDIMSDSETDADDDIKDKDRLVFEGLNFEFPRGKTTIVYGAVGAGKSTLLKLLLGEVPVVSGSVSTNFSRAAYCPQTPWISWGTVQSNIIGMALLEKQWYDTVIEACGLAADFMELPNGDHTPTGTRGSRLSGGQQKRVSLARALYSRSRTMILDDILSGLDRKTERSVLEAVFGPNGVLKKLGSTVVLASSSAKHLGLADYIVVLDEKGKISRRGSPESMSDIVEFIQDSEIETGPGEGLPANLSETPLPELELLEGEMNAGRGAGDTQVYLYYAKIAGWWSTVAFVVGCAAIVFGVTFPSVWLQWWTSANERHPNENIGYWLGVYGALVGVAVLGCAMADSVLNLAVLPAAAQKFHDVLLTTTMRASTSFLTSTDAGNTLNRFSQDLELIDSDLPMSLDSLVFHFLSAVASIVLVCTGSLYILAAIPVCICTLGIIQAYYLRTSRQMRLLDIEAKAPLFSQFLETIQGAASIRAYGWTQDYIDRNVTALNDSQRPYYLMCCIQRWLTVVLDLFNAGLAVLLVALATTVRNGSTGVLGVALFNILTLSSAFQTLIQEWTRVEIALGAIARVKAYVKSVKDENLPGEDGDLPDFWPSEGQIVLKYISASYNSTSEPVLKDIDLNIRAGEKVAICGRTGSGKSSLISTILRMLDLDSGTIIIDGVDISREVFFPLTTVRENLDPHETAKDEKLIEALRSVRLWDVFASRGGLDGDLSEDTLSHGEKQLFCLARALVQPAKVVIVDEAISSVDADADELIQQVLREKLQNRTVLAIAHKLDSVMDYDRAVLLERGRIVESGNPRELMELPTSMFRALYDSMSHSSYASSSSDA
ncbi:hypothetical protein RJ55_08589 [Drechmeria coniospora]|nr:hypothetical protein RJ55_08589 [Drechmeria coniospora]